MSKTYRYFGYGSLINTESLLATVPDATNIEPCYIKGFRRDFNLWDPIGWTTTNLAVAGEPFCVLDVTKADDPESRVNWLVFELSQRSQERLHEREREYQVIQTVVYDYESQQSIGSCSLFSANKNNGRYQFDSPAQSRYLQICLDSCEQYGERFRQEFINTTHIDGLYLNEFPSLIES